MKMNNTHPFNWFSCVVALIVLGWLNANSQSMTNVVDSRQYSESVDKLASVIPDPQHIDQEFEKLFKTNVLTLTKQKDWFVVRSNALNQAFSNLAMLETALKQVSLMSAVDIKPPNFKTYVDIDATTEDKISDLNDRQLYKSFISARKKQSELWNLNQALKAEHDRFYNKTIGLIHNMSDSQKEDDLDLKSLLVKYREFKFVDELSASLKGMNKE